MVRSHRGPPIPARDGGWKLMPSPAGISQAGRGAAKHTLDECGQWRRILASLGGMKKRLTTLTRVIGTVEIVAGVGWLLLWLWALPIIVVFELPLSVFLTVCGVTVLILKRNGVALGSIVTSTLIVAWYLGFFLPSVWQALKNFT